MIGGYNWFLSGGPVLDVCLILYDTLKSARARPNYQNIKFILSIGPVNNKVLFSKQLYEHTSNALNYHARPNQILLDKFNFFSDTLIHVQTTGLKGHLFFFPICVNSRTCIFGLFKNVCYSLLKMIKDMQLTKNCKIGIYNNQACNGCTLYVNN